MASDALEDTLSGNTPLSIRGIEGAIEIRGDEISGSEGLPVRIYAPSGICLFSGAIHADRAVIAMPRGIYVVRVSSSVAKVTVR